MNIIVTDLEWNQATPGVTENVPLIPFEIIEIGAVRYGEGGTLISEFSELVKPSVYKKMHNYTSKLVHLQMEELEKGDPFEEVAVKFFEWCGEDPVFATWGPGDVAVLQQNLRYFGLPLINPGPVAFIDVQKLYTIVTAGDVKKKSSLEHAVDHYGIEKDIPFHRAFGDAYYTAAVLKKVLEINPDVIKFVSYDTTFPPLDKAHEIKEQFPTYEKYITRVFEDREKVFKDRGVLDTSCYECGKRTKRKIKWFSAGERKSYCLCECEKHGLIKGRIVLHPSDDPSGFYVVKTLRFVDESDAAAVVKKYNKLRDYRKHRTQAKSDERFFRGIK